jgi:EF-P beta-lysylation protein EpmB
MQQRVAIISRSSPAWQQHLADAIREPAELLAALDLPSHLLPQPEGATLSFPLRVPRGYVALMERGNPNDPLLRQVLPLDAENAAASGFVTDPVGDLAARALPGVLHKYHGRALLIVTGACGVHCRYCFRRHYPYVDSGLTREREHAALAYLREDTSITEVILSGGDPLTLTDTRLAKFVAQLADIPRLQRLRIHTRLPVVLPERITAEFVDWLSGSRLKPVMVIHANHPRELDSNLAEGLARLAHAGVTLLNQSVLLRGVNDDPTTLAALSTRLFDVGVLPYYLHQLDRVHGAAHFEVTDTTARAVHRALMNQLPGYLVPRLVREQASARSKLPL